MQAIKKTAAKESTVKRGRGRPKGSVKVKTPWFRFYCPKCGAEFGAMTKNVEFWCKNEHNKQRDHSDLILATSKKPISK